MATAAPPRSWTSGVTNREVAGDAAMPWLALTALCVVALVLRLVRLDTGMWIDEIYALVHSFREPLGTIVTTFYGDTHHPLYAVGARLSLVAFGESAWSIRLPAVLFGVATIPLTYLLARRVTSHREGLLASALLAVSYHHVWFSQNARGYTMMAFFAMASTLVLLRALERGAVRDFVWYAALAALGAYTHLTMVFVAVGHALVVLVEIIRPEHRGHRLSWRAPFIGFGLAALLTVLLYAPMLGEVIDYFVNRPSRLVGVSTPAWALREAIRVLIVGFGAATVLLGGGVLMLGLVIGVTGFAALLRAHRNAALSFAFPVVVVIGGALVGRGTMYPRFFFFMAGIALIVGVHGAVVVARWIARRRRWSPRGGERLAGGLCVGLLVASIASLPFNYRYPKQDYVGAMQFVQSSMRGDDRAVFTGVPGAVYPDAFGVAWPTVQRLEEVEAARREGRTWLIYTFPRYLRHGSPAIADLIERECPRPRVFPGTVGGGDIMVCLLERT